jgi:hypothetical protein
MATRSQEETLYTITTNNTHSTHTYINYPR